MTMIDPTPVPANEVPVFTDSQRLVAIEQKLDELLAIVQEAREGIAGATANPMFRMMLKNFGLGG